MPELSTSSITAVAAAIASIAAILVQWWWRQRPQRQHRKRQEHNRDIANHADTGDADWFNNMLDGRMREDD